MPDADELAGAAAWVFRFNAKDRVETWTLRFAGTRAAIDVERSAGAPSHYTGTTDGSTFTLGTLSMTCQPAKLDIGGGCTGTKASKLDVLSCRLPGFDQPMPFAAAPGVEYLACGGYRPIAR
jgi:hypothetical protein